MHSHNSAFFTSFCLHLLCWAAVTQRTYLTSHNCDTLGLYKKLIYQELLWYNNHWLPMVVFTPSLYAVVTNYLKISIAEAKFKKKTQQNQKTPTQNKNNERFVFSSSISCLKDSFIKLGHNYLRITRYPLQAWMGATLAWSHYMMEIIPLLIPFNSHNNSSVQSLKEELKSLQERKKKVK